MLKSNHHRRRCDSSLACHADSPAVPPARERIRSSLTKAGRVVVERRRKLAKAGRSLLACRAVAFGRGGSLPHRPLTVF
jgi:hypothetical protein